jgi:hypothetical protein
MDKEEQIRLYNLTDYYVGLGLALFSSGFIGLYFIIFNFNFISQP